MHSYFLICAKCASFILCISSLHLFCNITILCYFIQYIAFLLPVLFWFKLLQCKSGSSFYFKKSRQNSHPQQNLQQSTSRTWQPGRRTPRQLQSRASISFHHQKKLQIRLASEIKNCS